MTQPIGIVGAGITGAVCARALLDGGHSVQVFDKGRGAGGRLSSRRTDTGQRFDHGASKIDATSSAMHAWLAPALAAGVLRRSDDTYTSGSGLNGLCKWLLDGITVRYSTKLIRVERRTGWHVFDETGAEHGPFARLVLSVPPPNAVEMLRPHFAPLADTIAAVRMMPRWVALLGFRDRVAAVPDTSAVHDHVLRRSPSNTVGDAMIVEASEAWSVEHVERDASVVGPLLLDAVRPLLGSAEPSSVVAHRWRYAFADRPLGRPFVEGPEGLYICGDWCLGTRVESAYQSAHAVAHTLLNA